MAQMLTDAEARALTRQVMEGGWAALDTGVQQQLRTYHQAKAALERRDLAKVVKDMAATPEGRRFLDLFLKPRTIEMRTSAVEAQATTAEAHSIAAARREGRASIWWAIQDALADETAAPAPQPTGDA